jgi:hypothetical protein
MLVIFLLEVLGACHNAGLLVVATVFDLGANNVKAFKQLGVSEKTPFFLGFAIKLLQQGLIPLIPLNTHVTFSINIM